MSFHGIDEKFFQINPTVAILAVTDTHPSTVVITRCFLIVCQHHRLSLFVDVVVEVTLHFLFTTEGVADLEYFAVLDHLALEHFEGLVGQLSTNGTTHVAVLFALVQMKHTDNATFILLGQRHQLLHDDCSLYSIVDVGHQVFNTVNDADVGLNGFYC